MRVSARQISRRKLIAGAGCAITGGSLRAAMASAPVKAGKTIDAHGHLTHHSRPDWRTTDRQVIDAYDKLGIDQGCCSILSTQPPATPKRFASATTGCTRPCSASPGEYLVTLT